MSCSPTLRKSVSSFCYQMAKSSTLCEYCSTAMALDVALTFYGDLLEMTDENEEAAKDRREAADGVLTGTIKILSAMLAEPDLIKRRAILALHDGNSDTSTRVN